jgi:hypothetical protein
VAGDERGDAGADAEGGRGAEEGAAVELAGAKLVDEVAEGGR